MTKYKSMKVSASSFVTLRRVSKRSPLPDLGSDDYGCGCRRFVHDNPTAVERYTPMVASGRFGQLNVEKSLEAIPANERVMFNTDVDTWSMPKKSITVRK